MKFSAGSIPWLLLVWAFYLGMGLPAWSWAPSFVLLVIGTILYLISFPAIIVNRSE